MMLSVLTVFLSCNECVFIQYVNSGAGGLAGAFIHEKHMDTVRPAWVSYWISRKMFTFFSPTVNISLSVFVSQAGGLVGAQTENQILDEQWYLFSILI